MNNDAVVHVEVVLGADIMVWRSGTATILPWDDTTAADSPAGRDLAKRMSVEP